MNYIIRLIKLAQILDDKKLYKEASLIDNILESYLRDGILTQCAWCNRILDPEDKEYKWNSLLGEIRNLSEDGIKVSHGICSECKDRLLRGHNKYSSYYEKGQAFWIEPDGTKHDTEGETHQGWIFNNWQYVDDKTGMITDLLEEMREDQDANRIEEINRIKEELEYYKEEGDTDQIKRLEEDLRLFEEELGYVDTSYINAYRLVSNLISLGWIRKADKYTAIHYEFFDNNSLNIIADDIFSNIQDFKKIHTIMLDNLSSGNTIKFNVMDWLNSGENLQDFIGENSRVEYSKSIGFR